MPATAPTAVAGTNTDQIATTKFVMTALSALSSQGKIVSYSLAQNGYCKWDIGLILQWGKISNNRADFPIAFTNFCSAATLFSRGSGSGTWYGDHTSINLSGISCITPDYVLNGTYLAIGL